MSTQLTLESVQTDFQQWRQNKPPQQSQIPENLRQDAVELLTDMTPGRITKALNISYAQLRAWSGSNVQRSCKKASPDFVALHPEPSPETCDSNELSLEFTQPDGHHWRLQGKVTTSQLTTFIRTLSTLPGGVQ
jgi:hypothetical protein